MKAKQNLIKLIENFKITDKAQIAALILGFYEGSNLHDCEQIAIELSEENGITWPYFESK